MLMCSEEHFQVIRHKIMVGFSYQHQISLLFMEINAIKKYKVLSLNSKWHWLICPKPNLLTVT